MAAFSVDTNRVYVGDLPRGRLLPGSAPAAPGLFGRSLAAGLKGTAPPASIKDVPMWVWHAVDDPVGVSNSRELVQALRQAGGHPIYTEFQVGDHVGGIGAGDMSPVIHDWLMAQRRGLAFIGGPRLTITTPVSQERIVTSAATVDLAGSAEDIGEKVTRVSWENLTTRAKG